jgi:hypothetical protein
MFKPFARERTVPFDGVASMSVRARAPVYAAVQPRTGTLVNTACARGGVAWWRAS